MRLSIALAAALCVLGSLGLATALPSLSEGEYREQFAGFAKQYNKAYTVHEMFSRFNAFKYWVEFVRTHNAGNHTWEAGLNQFSDLMPEEFNRLYLSGLVVSEAELAEAAAASAVAEPSFSEPVANNIDWRSKGGVTPVKNQGSCGSCWSFAATGVMEGFSKAKKGSLPNLSEQQLVDCAGSAGNHGCSGGNAGRALTWVAKSGGSCSQASYPYTGRNGSCKKCTAVTKIAGTKSGSGEATLQTQLNAFPVSVALDASGNFQSYKSGVFSGPCGTKLNHAVLAVGYTSSYWIVKNSWGTGWGTGGYIYIARGKNLCGINNLLAWAQ